MRRLTLLGERVDEDGESNTEDCNNKKTDSIELREKTWDPTKIKPKHSNPKVSAVSWITKRVLSVYACCQKVNENGAWKDKDVNEAWYNVAAHKPIK